MSLCALAVLSCNKQPKVEETPIEINLSISPSELSFTSENEVLFLEVETNASDTELSDNLSWLVIDKVEGGFNVEALENTSIDARSGELIVYAIEGNERETMTVKVPRRVPEPRLNSRTLSSEDLCWRIAMPTETELSRRQRPTGLRKWI